ncbi:MAG: DUF3618 domain-containing protein [Chloroflexi bacterium]|nr:DUF3618 domain-containing protein [Chloroflexota bacterium]
MGQGSDEVARDRTVVDAPSKFFNPPEPQEEPADRSVAEHKARIAGKRAEMSATIECIQTKLDPQRIKNQVTTSVREATVGRAQTMFDNTRYGLMDRVRENPIPAAMAAIGLGWLLTRKPENPTSRGGYRRHWDDDYTYDEPGFTDRARGRAHDMRDRVQGTVGDVTGRAQDTIDDLRSNAQSRVDDLRSTAQSRVDDLRFSAQSRVDDVRSTAQDTMSNVQDRAGAMREQAIWQAGRARGGIEQMLEENPLAVGAIALAVGAAFGLAAPSTPKENELFGDTRDKLMDRAQSMAQEQLQRAQSVAQKVATQAQDTIKEEVGGKDEVGSQTSISS